MELNNQKIQYLYWIKMFIHHSAILAREVDELVSSGFCRQFGPLLLQLVHPLIGKKQEQENSPCTTYMY